MAGRFARALDAELEFILPEGLAAPAAVPGDVFAAAVRTHLAPRRIDMQALASEVGIGRTTLYRRVGGREALLGEVVWYLARPVVAAAVRATAHLAGAERVVAFADVFMRRVEPAAPHRRFLDEEPGAALRVLTSRGGRVQQGMCDVIARLIELEQLRGAMPPLARRGLHAFLVVRIAEAFLYADILAEAEPDLEKAVDLIRACLAVPSRATLV